MKKLNLILAFLFLQIAVLAQAQQFVANDLKAVDANVAFLRKSLKTVSDDKILRIAKYLAYIKMTPAHRIYNATVNRLLSSSTQFLMCDSMEDLACLESAPQVNPNGALRVDALPDLGKPVAAGAKLDIEYYFTKAWYDNYINKNQTSFLLPTASVASKLGEKLSAAGISSLQIAIYGIDDITGTMAPVYNAVRAQVMKGIPVNAVVDINSSSRADNFLRDYDVIREASGNYKVIGATVDFSYLSPQSFSNWVFGAPLWLPTFIADANKAIADFKKTIDPNKLDENGKKPDITALTKDFLSKNFIQIDASFNGSAPKVINDLMWLITNKTTPESISATTRISYQYGGTMDFMRMLNTNIKSNDQAKAHIEYPFSGIMHNKFVVIESKNKFATEKAVWTGTANVARTCIGSEENANMSIYIKNSFIAQAFLDEFNEMFNPSSNDKPATLVTGAFHNKKRPNTKRLFNFTDGTQVRVHFSPTDDAEHKVILPMIYSSRKGDQIRISMFGSGGYELVRAFQSAAARGVDIKIAVDRLTGTCGSGTWIANQDANIFESNPYVVNPSGSIQARKSLWPKLNHHKTASLTRKMPNGALKPETIIIGSQNWSAGGNDINDENVVSITNKKIGLGVISAFNKEFDERIWTISAPVLSAAECKDVSASDEQQDQ